MSAGMSYPVGASLTGELYRYLRGETSQRAPKRFVNSLSRDPDALARGKAVAKVFRLVLKNFLGVEPAKIDKVNVAEFFSIAHALEQSPWLAGMNRQQMPAARVNEAPNVTTLFTDLAAATRTYFLDLFHARSGASKDITSLVELLEPQHDTVVNFNWDEVLDAELTTHCEVDYTLLGADDPDSVIMLKPHGSVGWYDVEQGIRNDAAYFIANADRRIPRSRRRVLAYYNVEPPRDIDDDPHPLLSCPPLITAPTFAKQFAYAEQQQIWQDVIEVCGRATDFVFLGYSMPPDDYLTRAAVRRALSARDARRRLRCVIVDRARSAERLDSFGDLFRGKLGDAHFKQWTFGKNDDQFGKELLRQLEQAVVE